MRTHTQTISSPSFPAHPNTRMPTRLLPSLDKFCRSVDGRCGYCGLQKHTRERVACSDNGDCGTNAKTQKPMFCAAQNGLSTAGCSGKCTDKIGDGKRCPRMLDGGDDSACYSNKCLTILSNPAYCQPKEDAAYEAYRSAGFIEMPEDSVCEANGSKQTLTCNPSEDCADKAMQSCRGLSSNGATCFGYSVDARRATLHVDRVTGWKRKGGSKCFKRMEPSVYGRRTYGSTEGQLCGEDDDCALSTGTGLWYVCMESPCKTCSRPTPLAGDPVPSGSHGAIALA